MKKSIVMSLCVVTLVLAAGSALAKTFYLSDGTAIGYRQVWQQGGTIYLLVNRDTLLEFAPAEVDQRRSLKAAGLKKFPRPVMKKRHAVPAPVARKKHAARPAAAKEPEPEVEEVVVVNGSVARQSSGSDVRHAKAARRGRGASAATGGGAAHQGLSGELVAAYENLHNAMKARDVAAVKGFLSSRKAAAFGDQEMAMIKAGVSLMPPNRTVTGSSVAPDGNSATLTLTAPMDGGSDKPGTGTIAFVREDGAWKVDQESWEFQMN